MSEHAAPPVPRRTWRSRIPAPLRHGVTIFLALLVIEYLVIPRLLAASQSISLLDQINIVWLVVAVVLEAAALFAYALLTRTLLGAGGPGVGTLFRIDLATTAISHVIPGGTAASATLGYRMFTARGVEGRVAAFAMATQGLGSAVVLNVLLWFSLVISIPFAGVHVVYALVALLGMLAILAFSAFVFAFTRGEQGAIRFVGSVAHRIPRVSEERVEAAIRHTGDSLRELWRDREQLRAAIGWAAANWLLDAACLWSFLASLHSIVNPVELFAAYGLANVLAVIPVTPAGLGFVETFSVLVLHSFGVPVKVATLGVLGWRLVNFWLPIPVGAGCYVSLRVRRGAGIRDRRKALSQMASEARQPLGPDDEAVPLATVPPDPRTHPSGGDRSDGDSPHGAAGHGGR